MDIQSIIDEWERGYAWVYNFTRDFSSLANLAEGIPVTNVKNAPVVGDVTLSNSVKQIPRNSIQQVPTLSAEINGTKLSTDAIVATFLLRRVVFNEDTFGNGVLSTMQMAAEQALTYGFQGLRANTGRVFNQFGTVLESLHYNDIVIEPGVFDAANSSYYHVRTRVTKGALKSLLDSAKKNKKTLWDTGALQELYDAGPQPQDYNRFLPRNQQNGGLSSENQYDIMTRYGVGPFHDITVYSPQLAKPLMRTKSKSKFGFPRVNLLVLDAAQLSPFGSSRVRRASPMSSYASIYLQSTAKMQLLNADAPIFKKGLFTSETPLRRGAQWESQDPNADIQIKELSNSTLQQYGEVLDRTDSKIMEVMGVTGVGGAGSSSAYQNSDAVQAQNQTNSMSSNQVTLVIESALRQYGLTGLDLYISEQVGQTPLIVDDEAKNAINQIEGPDFVGDDNTINIDWKAYYDRIHTMTVTVDLSITKNQLDDKKRSDLQDMLTVESQTGNPNDPASAARKAALSQELIQDTAPEVARQMSNQQQAAPAEPQSMPAVGGALTPAGQ